MEPTRSIDKSSEGSAYAEQFESDTVGQSSTSGGSELKPQKDYLVHKVTKFDTLAGLAVRYGLSVYDIKKANGLLSDQAMYARESLVIPLHPSSCDSGKVGVENVQDWMRGSTSKTPSQSRQYKPFSSASAWNTFVLVDDLDQRSTSEIELEMLDEVSSLATRRQDVMQRQEDHSRMRTAGFGASSSRPLMRRPPVPPGNKSSSISEYLTSMATSFIKTTEQLFGTSTASAALPKTESLFDKFKRVTASSMLSGNTDAHGQSGARSEGLGSKRLSEGSLSTYSQKDSSKLD